MASQTHARLTSLFYWRPNTPSLLGEWGWSKFSPQLDNICVAVCLAIDFWRHVEHIFRFQVDDVPVSDEFSNVDFQTRILNMGVVDRHAQTVLANKVEQCSFALHVLSFLQIPQAVRILDKSPRTHQNIMHTSVVVLFRDRHRKGLDAEFVAYVLIRHTGLRNKTENADAVLCAHITERWTDFPNIESVIQVPRIREVGPARALGLFNRVSAQNKVDNFRDQHDGGDIQLLQTEFVLEVVDFLGLSLIEIQMLTVRRKNNTVKRPLNRKSTCLSLGAHFRQNDTGIRLDAHTVVKLKVSCKVLRHGHCGNDIPPTLAT